MNTAQKRKMFPLFSIKGGLNLKEKNSDDSLNNVCLSPRVQAMADAAYAIAVTALWNGEVLSAHSQRKLKAFIRSFLLQSIHRDACYAEFVERVLLAREYVQSAAGRYVPSPEWWVDPSNEKGFKGTARWFAKLQGQRETYPLRGQVMKVVAEAVLDMKESPSAKNFHYWRGYFIERGWQGQLNLFLATVANMHYEKR